MNVDLVTAPQEEFVDIQSLALPGNSLVLTDGLCHVTVFGCFGGDQ